MPLQTTFFFELVCPIILLSVEPFYPLPPPSLSLDQNASYSIYDVFYLHMVSVQLIHIMRNIGFAYAGSTVSTLFVIGAYMRK